MIRFKYENSYMYTLAETGPLTYPITPLNRTIREGQVVKERCLHCSSAVTTYGDILFMKQIPLGIVGKFLAKNKNKYCTNSDCMYHYFDIRPDDKKLKTCGDVIRFAKNRIREEKLERLCK